MRASADTLAWLRAYYASLDGGRFEEAAELLHPDCRAVYPTGHAVEGRQAVIELTRRSLGALAGVRHTLGNVWEEGDEVIFEVEVTYLRHDRDPIVRPGAGVFVRRGGQIAEQRMYVDLSGVWE